MNNMPKRIFIGLIQGYRRFISPMFPPSCRFNPTCSQYAIAAIDRFGVTRGTYLGFIRICRCNPFVAGGYDPVPEAFSFLGNSRLSEKVLGAEADNESPPQD